MQRVHRRTRAVERLGGGGALGGGASGFDAEIMIFDLERGDLLRHPGARGDGVLHGVPQRRRGVHRGEHVAACRLDVGLEPFDLALGGDVRRFFGRERRGRLVTFGAGPEGRIAAGVELEAGRFLPGGERAHFRLDLGRRSRQLLDLLAVERHLLLETADLHLTRVSGLARRGGLAVRLHELEAQPFERRVELGEPRGSGRLALARIGQLGSRGLDGPSEHAVLLGELDFLPSPQFFAQPLVAPRFGGLALQRAALLFDFEHDVVDAGEVLLRRFELQLRGAATRSCTS